MKNNNLYKVLGFPLAVGVLMAQTASAQISINTVPIGDAGNAPDVTGYGDVAYNYNIGTTEVTASQYTAFLNAVAATDTYGLYRVDMGTYLRSQSITRSGVSGSYTYAVIPGNGNLPVSWVDRGDAARFVNWLQNGQPTGLQGPGTTETGAYTLNGMLGSSPGILGITRNAGATFGLPTENEWYKAAFYTPAAGGSYNLYATQSATQPNSRNGSASDPNSANYRYDDGIANGYNGGFATTGTVVEPSPRVLLLTSAGAFSAALGYYGTLDQSGNVTEITDNLNGAGTGNILRGGGAFNNTSAAISNTGRGTMAPGNDSWDIGFRIVMVPEPTTMSLAMLTAGILFLHKRRQATH